jgi:hypothetical protein
LLAFIFEFKKEGDIYQFLRRLRKNYYDNAWKRGNYVDWRYILQIIEKSHSVEDCFKFEREFEQIGNIEKPTATWYNDEEKIKDILKEIHRDEMEQWEDYKDFMGDLSPLIFKTDNRTIDKFDILQNYYERYVMLAYPINEKIRKLMDTLKRIDNIKHKETGYGSRRKDFDQHLHYCYKSELFLHKEKWFQSFFQSIENEEQYLNKLTNLLKVIALSTDKNSDIFIQTKFEDEKSIFELVASVQDINNEINFNWIEDLHTIASANTWALWDNRRLFIVILIYHFFEKPNRGYIGTAFRENTKTNGGNFNNTIGHYHKKTGNSHIDEMKYFESKILNESDLIIDLNKQFVSLQ